MARNNTDPRSMKQFEISLSLNSRAFFVWQAFREGSLQAADEKPYRNHYPPGRRHDEFKRGYDCAKAAIDKVNNAYSRDG